MMNLFCTAMGLLISVRCLCGNVLNNRVKSTLLETTDHQIKPSLEFQTENKSPEVTGKKVINVNTFGLNQQSEESNVNPSDGTQFIGTPDAAPSSEDSVEIEIKEAKVGRRFDNCSIAGCMDMVGRYDCLVCDCSNSSYTLIIVDCSFANLVSVPQNLPTNINHLLLPYNSLNSNSLYPGVFKIYSFLEVLQLDSNNISTLQDGVFEGLENLKQLNIYNNSIAMDSSLNASNVFSNLKSLEKLVMNRNNPNTSRGDLLYPDYALSLLSNLSSLYIDGLQGKSFGPLFGKLEKLTSLTISGYDQGYCFMESLRNDTLIYLNNLMVLNISDCGLNGSLVESNALGNLSQLQVLDLSNNFYLGLEAVGKLMYGLRDSTTLRHLRIMRIVPRFTPCILIFWKTLEHFTNTRLEIIEAMDNEIEMIQYGALSYLPKTLKTVNLTNNKIMFGAYWKNMGDLVSLEHLHLDGFFKPVKFPFAFPDSNFHCKSPLPTGEEEPTKDQECMCNDFPCVANQTNFMLPLPPFLKNVTMHSSSMAYIVNNISFCSNNSLENVDVSSNHFPTLLGPVLGLHRIKVLNMSSCFIETISGEFFDNMTSLEHINLYQNLLGDCLNVDEEGLVFDKLTNVKILNISFNNLYRLNQKAFWSMHNLEKLDLSINRLSHANFSIKHMKNLRFIDLHRNEIASLPPDMTEHISWLLEQGIKIRVDMRQNPIECDCGNLDFLQWVVDTRIFGEQYELYYCKFPVPDQQAVEMKEGFDDQVTLLNYSCAPHVAIFFTVAGVTLLMVIMLIIVLVYRFRWTLRYWYHAAKIKLAARQKLNTKEFKYDVFISYANKDIDFVIKELYPKLKERNIKILIHGEKFKVGRYITDNIYKAVLKSRKTLVVITKHMLESHWCNYELQMARMQAVSTGRNVLVFLFLEDIPSSKLGPEVLSHVQSSTYITYPSLPQHKGAFWDKLADDLRAS